MIWIGGRNWPCGGWEYNLGNDIAAANVVFASNVELWQIPRDVYRMMPVGLSELYTRVRPHGEIGRYLCDNVIRFNNAAPNRPTGYRILGDSPAIGVVLYEDCGAYDWRPAPELDGQMHTMFTRERIARFAYTAASTTGSFWRTSSRCFSCFARAD